MMRFMKYVPECWTGKPDFFRTLRDSLLTETEISARQPVPAFYNDER
jgi:hypothetical protein